MPNDGSVVFEITGDNRPVNQVLKDTTADIEKESKKWDKAAAQSTENMGNSFTSMFKTISAAAVAAKVGKVLLDWGKDAIQAASDLQEVQNVVDVTFGTEGAAKIEAWAQNAGKQFGLTETQAKKFTSTLGAMMKSAGMAGPEIVTMSEDLAGLAADMASFYNLDFETAFQKIRSGISGETEPLKQLGINMSVANLQAYALTQGITKAFDKMSQSEQTMLRYQYLMQATADAQGDFARTSDGYANGLRMLETNIESLKTKLGTLLIPAVSEAVGALNGLLEKLMPDESKRTVLDEFNDIDLDTEGKLAEIQKTAEEARVLIGVLNDIQGDVASKNLQDVAEAANELNIDSGSRWGNLVNALQDAGVIEDNFGGAGMGAASANLSELAKTLSSDVPASEKVSAWRSLIDTLSANVDNLSALTGMSPENTKAWLIGLSDGANNIDTSKPEAWELLFDALAGGLNLQIDTTDGESLGSIATGANKLDSGMGSRWLSLINALNDVGVIGDTFGTDAMKVAGENLWSLGFSANSEAPADNKVTAWKNLLGTLNDNADGLSAITGTSVAETAQWLDDLAAAADRINPNDADAWDALLDQLERGLPGLDLSSADYVGAMADSANKLSSTAGSRWENLLTALQGAGVINENFGSIGDVKKNISDLWYAFENYAPGEDKAKAWRTLLAILKDNSGALSELTGKDAQGTAEWLTTMAGAVDDIDINSTAAWEKLIGEFEKGFPDVNFGDAAQNLSSVATSVNDLSGTASGRWRSLISALQDSGVIKSTFNDNGTAKNISDISKALDDNAPDSEKVAAWNGLLSALTQNAEGLSTLTGASAEETKKWLEDLAAGANSLDPTKAESWETLFSSLVEGLPGLNTSEAGKTFFDALAGNFLAMGTESEAAKAGLAALGLSTDEIDTKQKMWLETCRRLVQTIPGLSEIINTETGEVKGGAEAIGQYVTAWEEGQRKLALMQALERKKAAYADKYNNLYDYELEAGIAKSAAERAYKAYTDAWNKAGGQSFIDKYWDENYVRTAEDERIYKEISNLSAAYNAAGESARKAREEYDKQANALKPALQQLEDAEAYISTLPDDLNIVASAAENAGSAIRQLTEDQAQAAQTALNELAPVLQTLADYYEDVRKATAQQVESAIGGFEKIITPAQKAREKMADLTKELEKAENKGEIQLRIADAESAIPTVQSMTKALQQQLEYINEYQRNLDEARRRGVSEDLLATLSDGSVESADYLAALATASKGEIAELNKAYSDVQAGKETFTDALTAQKLAADETFQGIVDKANEMVTALDMADGTKDALQSTIEGMAQGIAAAIPDLTTQVDNVIAQMERLNMFGGFSFAGGALAFGGGSGGLNYDALGDTIRTSAPKAGGNVYLNGRAVGTVVSAELGNSYRALARSGVQYTSEP